MQLFNLDTSKICYPEIKEYFEEVLHSYISGHYRSAIVLLYSVAICDIMKKLNEMKNFYNDTKATSILDKIEKQRLMLDPKKFSPTDWERNLLRELFDKKLFSQQEITNLVHLKDDRNLSAHPTLNVDYNLIQPTQEKTLAYIKDMYEIFTRPALFIDNITDQLTDDLVNKKDFFINDFKKLSSYISNVYISRMSDNLLLKVISAFWKFVFISTNDDDCMNNREINRKALGVLFESNLVVAKTFIKENSMLINKVDCSNKRVMECFIFFLSRHPEVYGEVSDINKDLINEFINRSENFSYKFISWFLSDNRDEYLKTLKYPLINTFYENLRIDSDFISYATKQNHLFSDKNIINDFLIDYYSKANTFFESDDRFENAIKPYLERFSKDNLEKLVEIIDTNSQHYNNYNQIWYNKSIKLQLDKVNPNFDYSKYLNFKV